MLRINSPDFIYTRYNKYNTASMIVKANKEIFFWVIITLFTIHDRILIFQCAQSNISFITHPATLGFLLLGWWYCVLVANHSVSTMTEGSGGNEEGRAVTTTEDANVMSSLLFLGIWSFSNLRRSFPYTIIQNVFYFFKSFSCESRVGRLCHYW